MLQFPAQQTTMVQRLGAALSYVGCGSLIALLWSRGRFVTGHARFAFLLHLSRLLISGVGLGAWHFFVSSQPAGRIADLFDWVWFLTGLGVLGVPLTFVNNTSTFFIVLALMVWLVDVAGIVLALQGRALPWDASQPSAEETPSESPGSLEEKARLRRLRDQRLARIRYATTTAASERLRERRISDSKHELGANMVRLDQLNHMLATGEISSSHYQQLAINVREEIEALREELTLLGARVATGVPDRPANGRVGMLGNQLHAQTISISFVDLGGVPLFTYGHFPLDEALVAGMLSAINSLSREVFGSPMHKTQLAEGQVLLFIYGQWCVLMVLFNADPSPAQITRLEAGLKAFEQTNAVELKRNPVSPARLHPVDFDTDFAQMA